MCAETTGRGSHLLAELAATQSLHTEFGKKCLNYGMKCAANIALRVRSYY
jgi:hypothetical protein